MSVQGEYIAPEKVENVYARSRFVAQSFLYGDSLKSCCVAIVVPDEEVLMDWAKASGETGDFKDLCQSQVSKREFAKGCGFTIDSTDLNRV